MCFPLRHFTYCHIFCLIRRTVKKGILIWDLFLIFYVIKINIKIRWHSSNGKQQNETVLLETLKYPPAQSSHINLRKPLKINSTQDLDEDLLSLINSKLRRNMIGVPSYRNTMTKPIIRITEARQNISRDKLSKSTNHKSYSVLGSMIWRYK